MPLVICGTTSHLSSRRASEDAQEHFDRGRRGTRARARRCGDDSDTDAAAAGDELCALATELFEQDDFPSVEQLQRYQQLAPESIVDAVTTVAEPLIASEGDLVESFKVLAEDDIEAAIAEIDAFEEKTCGIPHSEDSALPEGATREIEQDATRVDVHATDYPFDIGEVAPGRTSFVLVNDGTETHDARIVKLAAGVTLDEAVAAEGDEGTVVASGRPAWPHPAGTRKRSRSTSSRATTPWCASSPALTAPPHLVLGMRHEFTVH